MTSSTSWPSRILTGNLMGKAEARLLFTLDILRLIEVFVLLKEDLFSPLRAHVKVKHPLRNVRSGHPIPNINAVESVIVFKLSVEEFAYHCISWIQLLLGIEQMSMLSFRLQAHNCNFLRNVCLTFELSLLVAF